MASYLLICITQELDEKIYQSFIKKIDSPRKRISKPKVGSSHLKKTVLVNMHLIVGDFQDTCFVRIGATVVWSTEDSNDLGKSALLSPRKGPVSLELSLMCSYNSC